MAHQQQAAAQWSRDFLKCAQCRKEHKKCLPRARDWDFQRQKCDRCYRLGNPCGPPMRAQRSVPDDRTGVAEGLRPARRQTVHRDAGATNIIDTATSQSRSVETVGSHEEPTCLASLAAIISTHEVLLSRLLFLKTRIRNSESGSVKMEEASNTLETTIIQVHRAFKREILSVRKGIDRVRGLAKQLINWQMAYLDERHHNLLSIKSLCEVQAYVCQRDRRAAYLSPDTIEARILLCTSRIFYDSCIEPRTRFERLPLKPQDYIVLELYMKKLFQDIQEVDTDDMSPMFDTQLERSNLQELNPFPAAHVAYFNQDRDVALHLWRRLPDHPFDVDILGRTFVHIVAASQDLGTMTSVVHHAPDAVKHICDDKLGMNPIDLVDVQSGHAIRTLLRKVGAKSVFDPCRGSSRPASAEVARLADAQHCFHFGSVVRNNEFLTGTAEEALEDLEGQQFHALASQTMGNVATGGPIDFSQYPIPDQQFAHGNHATYRQGSTVQFHQHLGNSGHLGQLSTAYPMTGSQVSPGQFCNTYYNPGRSNG